MYATNSIKIDKPIFVFTKGNYIEKKAIPEEIAKQFIEFVNLDSGNVCCYVKENIPFIITKEIVLDCLLEGKNVDFILAAGTKLTLISTGNGELLSNWQIN